jgi:hypothetical protein
MNLLTIEIGKEGIREGRREQTGAHLILDEDKIIKYEHDVSSQPVSANGDHTHVPTGYETICFR